MTFPITALMSATASLPPAWRVNTTFVDTVVGMLVHTCGCHKGTAIKVIAENEDQHACNPQHEHAAVAWHAQFHNRAAYPSMTLRLPNNPPLHRLIRLRWTYSYLFLYEQLTTRPDTRSWLIQSPLRIALATP
jgi:hypothetical protein